VHRISSLACVVLGLSLVTACASGDGSDDAGEHMHIDDDAGAALGSCLVEGGTARIDFASGRALTFTSSPSPIPLNAPFTLDVTVLPADGAALDDGLLLTVDATMPAHGHGMNTTPSVTSATNGSFDVTGMQLHMPGSWRMTFEVAKSEGAGNPPTILDSGERTLECAE
jgi:hypothetical protein